MMIEVENLYFTYPGNVQALKGVNLSIEEGEFVAIVGPNGSGKTTLALHFNGLLKPTRGCVYVKGKDTRETCVEELSTVVGYVFQNPNHQLFNLTVRDEIAFALKRRLTKSELEERVEDALSLFGLKAFEDLNPFTLSLPLKKLVAMATVYAMKPEVFVLDEPTTGQDFFGAKLVENAVLKVRDTGKTIIVITHDMKFVARHAKRVIVMVDGEIAFNGEPCELFDQSTQDARKTLERAKIRPPKTALLSYMLMQDGGFKDLPANLLTPEEFVEALAKLRSKSVVKCL
jgi:energy-coupling factor transport system ATP-binding protein